MQDRMAGPDRSGMPREVFDRYWREKGGLGPVELKALEEVAGFFRVRIQPLDEEAKGIIQAQRKSVAAGQKLGPPPRRLAELDREKRYLVLDLRWLLHQKVGLGKLNVLDSAFPLRDGR